MILLGYPTWWATTQIPIVSFIEEYDISGKTVIVFSSHGGTMFGDSVSQVSKLAPGSYIGILLLGVMVMHIALNVHRLISSKPDN